MEDDHDLREEFIKKVSLDSELLEEIEQNELLRRRPRTLSEKLKAWKLVYFSPIHKGSIRSAIFCLLTVTIGFGIYLYLM